MQVAIIGLGRMGRNIALHLLEQEVSVVVYNRSRDDVDEMVASGATAAYTLSEIPQKFSEKPVTVILFVPAGVVVDEVLFGARAKPGSSEYDAPREKVQPGLIDLLPSGSIIIDGGNSFFQDSIRRYQELKTKNLHFLDMGTSGGLEGARNGACLMVGGDEEVYKQVEPILVKIATTDGYGYFGPSGAGHFVKMVHNAIEYGMMGSMAEGFNLAKNYESRIMNTGKEITSHNSVFNIQYSTHIDLVKLARVWTHGSIISGHLMNMAEKAFTNDSNLDTIAGEVPRGETEKEMEWLDTIGIPNPVIQASRQERVETRTKPSFIGKVIAALRREFGGHATIPGNVK